MVVRTDGGLRRCFEREWGGLGYIGNRLLSIGHETCEECGHVFLYFLKSMHVCLFVFPFHMRNSSGR